MFSKDNKAENRKPNGQPTSPLKPAPPSLISRDLKIVGNIKSDGEVQIDGSVEGDVKSKTLLIGESAHIKGAVTANSVVVQGTVNGQIKAHSVKLAKTGHVVGDVMHQDLSIETGAFIEGHCRRMDEEQTPKLKWPNASPGNKPETANIGESGSSASNTKLEAKAS
ncbi:MAG: cell shape determination protein CcmA [Magnetovibrio sp.]|nr:cell shape determination protein CcmA [Magnetovibrio sp.]|tara:strand:+ start:508 stop:1005 length:498 start_codon:yes stop_codon:yes gene_type:complete